MDIKKSIILILVSFAFTGWMFGITLSKSGIYTPSISNIVELRNIETGIDADDLIDQIKKVLRSNPKRIKIKVNSSGGRIVQGERIYNYLSNIKIPVHSYIDNECLSACYYAISSSDIIYASKSSVVGNIGVMHPEPIPPFEIFAWAGKYKNTKPEKEFIRKHLTKSAITTHKEMIKDIKKFRETRLKGSNQELFEGLIWTGIDAKRLGLIDEYGDLNGF